MLSLAQYVYFPLRERKVKRSPELPSVVRPAKVGPRKLRFFGILRLGDRLTVGGSFWRRPTGHELTDQVTKQEANDKPNERNHGAFGHG